MTFIEMFKETALDVHPPLYYCVLILMCKILGNHYWVYHLVSLIPYFISLVFIMTIILKQFGNWTSVLMVTFISIMNTSIQYNVEVRMYSWAAMFILLAFYALYKIINDGTIESYLFFIIASLGAAYLHYYALLSIVFLYLALFVMVLDKKISIKNLIFVYISTIIGYLPWLLVLINTIKRTTENFWITEIPSFFECMQYFFESENLWYSNIMILFILSCVLIRIFIDKKILSVSINNNSKIKIQITGSSQKISKLNFWVLWGIISCIGTIMVGCGMSLLIRPVLIKRYLYPVTIIIWMVASVVVPLIKKWGRVVSLAILIITLIVCLPNYVNIYTNDKKTNDNCKSTQKYFINTIHEEDYILTNGVHLAWTILPYYLPNIKYKYISSEFNEFDDNLKYWLVWTRDLSESDLSWISENNFTVEEFYHEGILGNNQVHLYCLNKIKQ